MSANKADLFKNRFKQGVRVGFSKALHNIPSSLLKTHGDIADATRAAKELHDKRALTAGFAGLTGGAYLGLRPDRDKTASSKEIRGVPFSTTRRLMAKGRRELREAAPVIGDTLTNSVVTGVVTGLGARHMRDSALREIAGARRSAALKGALLGGGGLLAGHQLARMHRDSSAKLASSLVNRRSLRKVAAPIPIIGGNSPKPTPGILDARGNPISSATAGQLISPKGGVMSHAASGSPLAGIITPPEKRIVEPTLEQIRKVDPRAAAASAAGGVLPTSKPVIRPTTEQIQRYANVRMDGNVPTNAAQKIKNKVVAQGAAKTDAVRKATKKRARDMTGSERDAYVASVRRRLDVRRQSREAFKNRELRRTAAPAASKGSMALKALPVAGVGTLLASMAGVGSARRAARLANQRSNRRLMGLGAGVGAAGLGAAALSGRKKEAAIPLPAGVARGLGSVVAGPSAGAAAAKLRKSLNAGVEGAARSRQLADQRLGKNWRSKLDEYAALTSSR